MSFKEISAPNTLAFSSHFFFFNNLLQFKTQKQNVLKNLVSQKKTRASKYNSNVSSLATLEKSIFPP